MGILEQEAKKQRRIGQVQAAALSALAISGMLLVAMAAPNVLQLLRYTPKNKYRFNNQAKTALSRLAARGYVVFIQRRGKRYARITEAGRQVLMMEEQKLAHAKKPKRWDRRWRAVIFDIPERRRKTRDSLRSMMQRLNFYRLQDSVWVYPYECEDLMALLKADLKLGSSVIYMIVEKIENDRHLLQHFDLK